MKVLRSLSTKTLIAAIFISILAGCSPAEPSTSQPLADEGFPNQFDYPTPAAIDKQLSAINEIRKTLELPESPLEFVEMGGTINNAPAGVEGIAIYQDSEGRRYSVDVETNQVVEIDARTILSNIPTDTLSLSPDEIKTKAMKFAKTVIPDFESLQSSLQYEEGGKVDNYFFMWTDKMSSGSMNYPFLQIAFHKSGVLFAYYNTLSLEK